MEWNYENLQLSNKRKIWFLVWKKKTQVQMRTREKTEKQSLSQLVNAFHNEIWLQNVCMRDKWNVQSTWKTNATNKSMQERFLFLHAFYFARFHYCIIFMHVVDMVLAFICRWLFINGLNFHIMCHFSFA